MNLEYIQKKLDAVENMQPAAIGNLALAIPIILNNDGLVLEFGVHEGTSITVIAETLKGLKPNQKVYGFDSFEGLPEAWGEDHPIGTFKMEKPPVVPDNVELVIGLFQDTLDKFLEEHDEPVAFCHLDCDIYSAAAFVLTKIAPRCRKNTVIAFDEIFGSQRAHDHERKAFIEFLQLTGYDFSYVARRKEDAFSFALI